MSRYMLGHRQSGSGLVEIMVALIIGLLLMNGLFQIFISNKQSFRVQESQSRLQENARMASVYLGSYIAKTGFYQNAQDDPATIFTGGNVALVGTNNNADTTDQVLDGTDTITIRLQGDGNVTDCKGIAVAAGVISRNDFHVNIGSELACDNNDGTGFRPLLGDVQNLQILYGVDSNGDGSVDQYQNAGSVTNFNNVLSVHVALLLASDRDVKPAAESKSYTLLDTTMTLPPTGTDRIQRRAIERVVALRNRIF